LDAGLVEAPLVEEPQGRLPNLLAELGFSLLPRSHGRSSLKILTATVDKRLILGYLTVAVRRSGNGERAG
jgi:hypothetical protein